MYLRPRTSDANDNHFSCSLQRSKFVNVPQIYYTIHILHIHILRLIIIIIIDVSLLCYFQIFNFSWVFGEFLCKMYQFVHALSYTASIFILMIICMERYFAIIYPITCKQILTPTRLRVTNFRTQYIFYAHVWVRCRCVRDCVTWKLLMNMSAQRAHTYYYHHCYHILNVLLLFISTYSQTCSS